MIEQKPKYTLLPSGEPIIFTTYHSDVLTHYKVKYIAYLYVFVDTGAITQVATVKVSPNSTGRGIFDFSKIIDSYVSPDYEGGKVRVNTGSNYSKANTVSFDTTYHDIHRIDQYATCKNSIRLFKVIFEMEGATTEVGNLTSIGTTTQTQNYLVYNGVLDDNDILNMDSNNDIGYNLGYHGFIMNSDTDKFLTNSPTTQYLRDYDYHTMAFFTNYDNDFEVGGTNATNPVVYKLKIQFYYNGSTTGSLLQNECNATSGGFRTTSGESCVRMILAGVGIGNIRGAGLTVPANWDYYEVYAKNDNGDTISDTYKFYKQDEDCKGYETIRLTWLNKFGVWDYYNFTKKSVRTFTKQSPTYQQQVGTWNESTYKVRGYKGGSRSLASSVQEKITVNTDYITEAEAQWLEELFISTDVFILEKSSTDISSQGAIRKYVTPVLLDSTEHVRKTTSNNGLIQYTFELTKSINRKTQRR